MDSVKATTQRPVPPARAAGAAELSRVPGGEGEEALVELRPTPRVVGPGRRERAYQARILVLETDLAAGRLRKSELEASLETATLLERGTGRLADRLESEVEAARADLEEVRAQANRLLVAIGSLQHENEGLRAELRAARTLELPPAPAKGWRRLLPFGR